MTRHLLLATLSGSLLVGCVTTFGPEGDDVYQTEGVTLSLFLHTVDSNRLVGELLAVEPSAFVLDAFQSRNGPRTVVRVPLDRIAGGHVFARSDREEQGEAQIDDPLIGYRRVGTLGAAGQPRRRAPFLGRMSLQMLSRFPDGLDGAVLDTLLAHRGQSEIRPYLDAVMTIRETTP